MFEENFRAIHEDRSSFTYDLSELYAFLESLYEVFILVYNEKIRGYLPHGKDWIKSKIYKVLSKQITSFEN